MKCPECCEDMTQGVLWLGVLSSTAKVVFSPLRGVSWLRRRLAGTVFYNSPREGEVEVLAREWTDAISERNSFFCRPCGILVCRVDSPGQRFTSDVSAAQSVNDEVPM
jgi:hypothetical protein